MVALVFSILLTIYLIIPEAIFRFIFGFYVPARSFVLTRTETAYRAVLVTLIPFSIALALSWSTPPFRSWPFPVTQNSNVQRRADYKLVVAGLYSDSEFTKTQGEFWPAFTRCSRRQLRLVSWYFLLLGIEAWGAGAFASSYAKFKDRPFYGWLSDKLLSPYISQWHPLLTRNLLPGTLVQADLLCTNNTLYQGNVSQYFLKDGELSGIILDNPRRFARDDYLRAKHSGEPFKREDFWVNIPSQHMYFFSDKIVNINLSYVTDTDKVGDLEIIEKFLADALSSEVGKLTISVSGKAPNAKQSQQTGPKAGSHDKGKGPSSK